MEDKELKKLLLETCPVRPGQEARAWAALRDKLYGDSAVAAGWRWLFVPTWRGLAVAVAVLALIPIAGNYFLGGFEPISFATADSQAPGIYATAFYSKPAKAQVVWLNGMGPATDQPTYLEPTTRKTPASHPARDPNSL